MQNKIQPFSDRLMAELGQSFILAATRLLDREMDSEEAETEHAGFCLRHMFFMMKSDILGVLKERFSRRQVHGRQEYLEGRISRSIDRYKNRLTVSFAESTAAYMLGNGYAPAHLARLMPPDMREDHARAYLDQKQFSSLSRIARLEPVYA